MDLVNLALFGWCWLCGFLVLWRIRTVPKVRSAGPPRRLPVSIIIPARNEERTLPTLLGSLAKQLAQEDEVIVVDDHSADATAAVAGRWDGVRLLRAPERSSRQSGKSLACWTGARSARHSLLLFLDADVAFLPGALDRILRSYPGPGHVWSVQPYHRLRRTYEQFSLFFNIIMLMGLNNFSLFSRFVKPEGAFGPFLLCAKDDYLTAGGHAAVSEAILEDIALGRLFRKRGIALTSFAGRGSVEFRMYPDGLGQLVEGWKKNFSLGAFSIHPVLLLVVFIWITGAVAAVMRVFQSLSVPESLPVSIVCYLLYVAQIFWFARRIGNFSALSALLYPIALVFFLAVFMVSAFASFILKRVAWKGRTIELRKKKKR